jgi:AcrR family transcriptional regulator
VQTPSKRERATPLPPEDRRQAIIEAVVPLLIEHGPTATTRQIAEAAGVAEGTLFRVFPDKRALLFAVAEHLLDPDRGEATLADAVADAADLESKVIATIEQSRARMEQVLTVMTALRHIAHDEGGGDKPPSPPAFLVEANRRFLDAIADHVFAPHADELRVTPQEAALVLRSLVFGMWHPGTSAESRMSADQLASILLKGLAR